MFTERLATMCMSSVLLGFPVTLLVRQAFRVSVIRYKYLARLAGRSRLSCNHKDLRFLLVIDEPRSWQSVPARLISLM